MKLHFARILFLFIFSNAFGQITGNSIELRILNDNAGQLSNIFNTGSDLGQTYALRISANLQKLDSIYNYRIKIESTEYAALYERTPEPRDIIFTELNNFQLAIDNNKFKNNSFFFSSAAGLYYITGRRSRFGATGQKNYIHNKVISQFWKGKYWIYVDSPVKDKYIPYAELQYGHTRILFDKSHASLITINNLEGRVSSDINFTGIGARTYFDLKLINDRFRMHTIDIEFEGYYLTNLIQYQIANMQIGVRFNFKHTALYLQTHKPIKKHLINPHIKYDDMELLFIYGFAFVF